MRVIPNAIRASMPRRFDRWRCSVDLQLPAGIGSFAHAMHRFSILFLAFAGSLLGQQPPYDLFPPAGPPYYRVRYEASTNPGELVFPVNYTIWIPPGVKTL